jgi:hypothetical protein
MFFGVFFKKMPYKRRMTKKESKGLVVGDGIGLRPEWIRFIDEYMKDFNQTRAYQLVFKIKKSSVASASSTRLLSYEPVRAEILARLKEQQITEGAIKCGLWDTINWCLKKPTASRAGVAIRGYEVLAKVKGMIRPDNNVNNFFDNRKVIFQPIVDKDRSEEFERLFQNKGNLIE